MADASSYGRILISFFTLELHGHNFMIPGRIERCTYYEEDAGKDPC